MDEDEHVPRVTGRVYVTLFGTVDTGDRRRVGTRRYKSRGPSVPTSAKRGNGRVKRILRDGPQDEGKTCQTLGRIRGRSVEETLHGGSPSVRRPFKMF